MGACTARNHTIAMCIIIQTDVMARDTFVNCKQLTKDLEPKCPANSFLCFEGDVLLNNFLCKYLHIYLKFCSLEALAGSQEPRNAMT